MSKNYTQNGIGESTEFGKGGNRVATNPLAPSGQRIEMRENDDATPSRTSGAAAVEPDDYITFAQFQSQSKWISPVRVTADTNQALNGIPAVIDGINTLVDGDRISLINQTDPIENGVWIIRPGAWGRPEDFPNGGDASDRTWLVAEGDTYENWRFQVSTDPGSAVIDTDPLTVIPTNMGTAGVTSLSNVGGGTRLFAAPDPRQGMIDISTIAQGEGISVSGTPGVTALTIDALVDEVAGILNSPIVNSSPGAGNPYVFRGFTSSDSSVTIGLDGNNINLQANATAPLYEATFFVDPNGSALATGRTPSEPTTYTNAITQVNAFPGSDPVLISLAAGQYDDGDGPGSGTTTITRDNVKMSAIAGDGTQTGSSSTMLDSFSIQGIGFSSEGIEFIGSFEHAGDVGGVAYRDVSFSGGVSFDSPGAGTRGVFTGCTASSFSTSGAASGGDFLFEGGDTIGSMSFAHSGSAAMGMQIVGVGDVGGVQLSQTSTGALTYRVNSVPAHGILESTTEGNNEVFLTDVTFNQVNGSSESIDLDLGEGLLEVKDCILNTTAARGAINFGAGYTNALISNTLYNQQSSTFTGTLAEATNAAEADQYAPEFANSMKVLASQNDSAPRLLATDPANGNLVQWVDAASLAPALPYDTIYYVSLTGDPLNNGLTINEPTDLATALANANAAGNATVALLDQGTYSIGGTINISGTGVSIVSFFDSKLTAAQPTIVSDNLEVDGSDFTSKGIGWSGTVTINAGGSGFQSCALSQGANIVAPSDIDPSFKDCVFGGDLTVTGAVTGEVGLFVVDSGFEGGGISLSHSGAGNLFVALEGMTIVNGGISLAQTSTGQTLVIVQGCASMGTVQTSSSGSGGFNISLNDCGQIEGIDLAHSSTGSAIVRVQGAGAIQSIDLQTTGAASFDLSLNSCDAVPSGMNINYSATGDSNISLANIRTFDLVNTVAVGGILNFLSQSVAFTTNVNLTAGAGCTAGLQSCSVGGGNSILNIGAGWSFKISDTSFDPLSPLLGTEDTSPSGLSSQFSSASINAQPSLINPEVTNVDILIRNGSRGFVETVSSGSFQKTLTAGQGINPTQLAAPNYTAATADPIESTQTPGVNLTLYRPFSGQGNGSVAVGVLPTNARVLQTRVVITSAATAGNADLGYSGGSELQNGATDNDVTAADTYINSNLIEQNAAPQNVTLDFSGVTGTADGLVVVEYFIAA